VTRRTWVAVAAGTLTLTAATALLVGGLHSAEPPAQTPEPPLADLQPPEPDPPLPVTRWPLGAPANQEAPRQWSWSRPEPLRQSTTAGFAPDQRPVEPPDWLDRPVKSQTGRAPSPLTGTHVTVLDGGHLTLPPLLKEQMGDLRGANGKRFVFVTPGKDGCLWLMSAAGLEKLGERLEKNGQSSRSVRQARRLCYAQTEACPVDRDGRLCLPEHFLRSAGLSQQVVLVGVGDRVELWDARHWQDDVRSSAGTATHP
jgi:MraZ protein